VKQTILLYGLLGGVLIAVLKMAEMAKFAEMCGNPLINSAMTFMEPVPVALVVALVSAGVLSRRKKAEPGPVTA
jgi:hypothetical protein